MVHYKQTVQKMSDIMAQYDNDSETNCGQFSKQQNQKQKYREQLIDTSNLNKYNRKKKKKPCGHTHRPHYLSIFFKIFFFFLNYALKTLCLARAHECG